MAACSFPCTDFCSRFPAFLGVKCHLYMGISISDFHLKLQFKMLSAPANISIDDAVKACPKQNYLQLSFPPEMCFCCNQDTICNTTKKI